MISALSFAAVHVKGPHIDWSALTTVDIVAVGAILVLMLGLIKAVEDNKFLIPGLTVLALLGSIAADIAYVNKNVLIIAGALRIDGLTVLAGIICAVAAIATVIIGWRSGLPNALGSGEFHSILLFSVMGMVVLVGASDIVTLFLGLELLSIPLYILSASEYRRERSLEAGLKYLIVGSVGSATLLYGLAMVYGATGQTSYSGIAQALGGGSSVNLLTDTLLLGGIAFVMVGFAFKASVAPFHQWTPDVYEGAPTPVTMFMATATKVAALAAIIRFFDVAVISAQGKWSPALGVLAALTMIVGNVGALSQTSLKRMLGYSGVAQAGYMLSGVVVGTRLGASATILYLIAYVAMNIAAFAVIHHVETEHGDDRISSLSGLAARSPLLAGALTVSMLALAGFPGTIGFIGKFQLIHALVDGGHAWLAIVLVVGAMISLGYYLRVVAAIWMGGKEAAPVSAPAPGSGPLSPTPAPAPIAGGSPELDHLPQIEVVALAVLAAAFCIFFGIVPQPLFHLASHAGAALLSLVP